MFETKLNNQHAVSISLTFTILYVQNMPDYQRRGEVGSVTAENGGEHSVVALYKPPNMMAGAIQNNTGVI